MKHLLLAALMLVAAPAGAEMPRVVALSWEGLEMLTDLGVTPVGGADLAGYATWVVQPALPAGIGRGRGGSRPARTQRTRWGAHRLSAGPTRP